MNLKERQLSYEYKFKGRIINLRQDKALLPNGNTATREVVEHPGGVCVAALTDSDELLFVKQFRYPYMEETLEIPAGKRDKQGEDPLECGKRELKEETGLSAKKITYLGEMYTTPALIDEIIHLYIAEDLSSGEQSLDEDEFINVEKMSLEAAVKKVLSGEIKDSKTQTIVLRAAFATGLAERK